MHLHLHALLSNKPLCLLLCTLGLAESFTASAQQTQAQAKIHVERHSWGEISLPECPPQEGDDSTGSLKYKAVISGTRFRLTNKAPEVASMAPDGAVSESESVRVVEVSDTDGFVSLHIQCLSAGTVDIAVEEVPPQVEERLRAVRKLGDTHGPESFEVLARTLRDDPDARVRIDSARSFGRVGDPAAVAVLSDGLREDPRPDVRAETARSLGRLPSSESYAALVNALGDRDPSVIIGALDALATQGNPEALSPIEALLSNRNANIAESACAALGKLQNPAAGQALLRTMQIGMTPGIRAYSALSLGQLGRADETTVTALRRVALSDNEDLAVRAAALKALGLLGSGQGAPAALELLNDREALLRKFAVFALVETDVEKATFTLPKLLAGDPDITVRRAVATAMGLAPDNFAEALVDDVTNSSQDTEARLIGFTALDDVGRGRLEKFAGPLATALDVGQPVEIQIATVRLLRKIDSEGVRSKLESFGNAPNLDAEVKKVVEDSLIPNR